MPCSVFSTIFWFRDEVARWKGQTDQADHVHGWLSEDLGSSPACKPVWMPSFLSPLFPHLFNGEVGLEDLQGPLQFENAIILMSSHSAKEKHIALGLLILTGANK